MMTSGEKVNSEMLTEKWRECTGKGVQVAVIDSGIESEHTILKGKVVESLEYLLESSNKVSFHPSNSGDSAGHGTACAGIISAIAPDAELVSIKVLGADAQGAGYPFLAGLEYAIKRRFRLINLSLGTTKPQLVAPLRDLLDRAYQAGCIVVAAANNLPQPSFPSIFSSSLIAVSKGDFTDPFAFHFRFGEVIELVAPGVNVQTAWLNNSFRQLTGNSFACSQIVGIIALMLEDNPNLTPFQIKTILYSLSQIRSVDQPAPNLK